jgi:hypothetical protein
MRKSMFFYSHYARVRCRFVCVISVDHVGKDTKEQLLDIHMSFVVALLHEGGGIDMLSATLHAFHYLYPSMMIIYHKNLLKRAEMHSPSSS